MPGYCELHGTHHTYEECAHQQKLDARLRRIADERANALSRTEEAERIADNWLGAEYSEAHNLAKYLPTSRQASLRAALITAALNGITSVQNGAVR